MSFNKQWSRHTLKGSGTLQSEQTISGHHEINMVMAGHCWSKPTIATLYSLQPCQSKKRMGVDSCFRSFQKWQSIILYIEARFNLWHFPHTLIFEPFTKKWYAHISIHLNFLPAWMNQLSTNGKSMKAPFPFGLYWQKERKKKSPLSTLTTNLAWWKSDHHFSLYHAAPLGKNSFYRTHY